MIQASIYAPSDRQGIASAGLISTRSATILAHLFILTDLTSQPLGPKSQVWQRIKFLPFQKLQPPGVH